ncbi:oligosaccharide repeat unit polymerase [Pseudomonadales bacterium]|nr:oligosaccharide repeat unit polymerase [Pseudomonadales bacterium]
MLGILFFIFGFACVLTASANFYSIPMIFGVFYFLAVVFADPAVFLLASVSFIVFGLGLLLCNKLHSFNPASELNSFRSKPFKTQFIHPSWLLWPLSIVCVISLLVAFYYFSKVGISLFSNDVGYDRLVNRYSIPGARIMQRFFRVYLPIVTIVYYLFNLVPSLRKYYSTTLFMILLSTTSFLLIATGMRGNIIIFMFVPFLYIRSLVKPIKFSEIAVGFAFTFAIGLFATVQMYTSASSGKLIEIIWSRLTGGASDGLSFIILNYTASEGFQYGLTYYNDIMSIFSKLGLTSVKYVTLGEEIAIEMLGSRYNGERAAVYFSGELYHNFGYPGVLVGSLAVGYILQFLLVKTLRSDKDVVMVASLGFVTAAFTSILGGPVIATIFDYAITISFFVLLILFINIVLGFTSRRVYAFGKWFRLKK